MMYEDNMQFSRFCFVDYGSFEMDGSNEFLSYGIWVAGSFSEAVLRNFSPTYCLFIVFAGFRPWVNEVTWLLRSGLEMGVLSV